MWLCVFCLSTYVCVCECVCVLGVLYFAAGVRRCRAKNSVTKVMIALAIFAHLLCACSVG